MRRTEIVEGKKLCSLCKEMVSVEFYNRERASFSGLQSSCKPCTKRRYEENKLAISEWGKQYYRENTSAILERAAAYRELNRNEINSWQKEFRESNPQLHREYGQKYSRTTKYGLLSGEFERLNSAQDEVCSICKQPEVNGKRLSLDHDHACCSGKRSCGKCIRGLLCCKCNIAIGRFRDSVEHLLSAAKYLAEYQVRRTYINSQDQTFLATSNESSIRLVGLQ